MNKIRQIVASIVIIIFAGISCSNENDSINSGFKSGLQINSGTSYGMCLGYCVRTLKLSGTSAVYNMQSHQPEQFPQKNISGIISYDEWQVIQSGIDYNTIKNMQDVYGCPDCADGGAEWIEIITNTYYKKITFEVHDVPAPIKELVSNLRIVRDRFNPD